MPDRETLIKAVECRKTAHKRCGNPCERTGACAYAAWIRDPDGTPYYPCYCDVERLCDDVLALLREQEPVTMKPFYFDYICSGCGSEIDGEFVDYSEEKIKFCPKCGRRIAWDG